MLFCLFLVSFIYQNETIQSGKNHSKSIATEPKARGSTPYGAPDQNNTNQDDKSRFVLFFARDFFGMIVRLK